MRTRSRTIAVDRPLPWALPMSALLLLSALAVSGCNTMSGLGEDVKQTGQALEKNADTAKDRSETPAPAQ